MSETLLDVCVLLIWVLVSGQQYEQTCETPRLSFDLLLSKCMNSLAKC